MPVFEKDWDMMRCENIFSIVFSGDEVVEKEKLELFKIAVEKKYGVVSTSELVKYDHRGGPRTVFRLCISARDMLSIPGHAKELALCGVAGSFVDKLTLASVRR